jgi:hypothetical protein
LVVADAMQRQVVGTGYVPGDPLRRVADIDQIHGLAQQAAGELVEVPRVGFGERKSVMFPG